MMAGLNINGQPRPVSTTAQARPVSNSGLAPVDVSPPPQEAVDDYNDTASLMETNANPEAVDSALAEFVEAISHLGMGITTVPFGENEVLVLNGTLLSFSSALKALKRSTQSVGGETEVAAQRTIQSVSGMAYLLRQLNEEAGACTPGARSLSCVA